MQRYTDERKVAVLGKLSPQHNKAIPDIAAAKGISEYHVVQLVETSQTPRSSSPYAQSQRYIELLESSII